MKLVWGLIMIEKNFIKNNIKKWKSFEETLNKLTSKGFIKFDSNELDVFINDYHTICSHLSYSRTNYKDSETTIFLNNLVATAHSYIYLNKTSKLKSIVLFYLKDFPLLIKNKCFFIFLTFAIFISGVLLSFILTLLNTDNSIAFIPEQYTNIDISKSSISITLSNSAFASNILANNIKVGLFAFSLGLTFGIGTVIILYKNAFFLGSLSALAFKEDLNLLFWSQILPHGILEIFSIIICSASGLILGYSLINPGKYSRKASIISNGKISVKLTLGTIPFFVISGIIEAFITPNSWANQSKIIFSLVTFVVLVLYLVIPNKKFKLQKIK
jgi:uncharacterized membrane protein SpoIIM required for sporulation